MQAGQLEIQLFANMARLSKDMNQARRTVGDAMGGIEKRVQAAKNLMATLGLGLGIGALVQKFKQVATETDRLRGSLETVTGSSAAATDAFDRMTRFASETPFALQQSVEAFIKLKALGLDPSEAALKSYGNTAAAMGKDLNQMIEAVADATTGEFERLKEFGIKSRSEGDNVSFTFQGITTTVRKNAEEIEGYLRGIGDVQFAGAMENQMNRLPGLLSNLGDSVDAFFRKIGDAGATDIFGSGIKMTAGLVTSLTNNFDGFISQFQVGMDQFKTVLASVEAATGGAGDAISTAWSSAFDTMTMSTKAWKTAFMAQIGLVEDSGVSTVQVFTRAWSIGMVNLVDFTQKAAVGVGSTLDKLVLEINRFRAKDAEFTFKVLSGLGLQNSAWAQSQRQIYEDLSQSTYEWAVQLQGVESAAAAANASITEGTNAAFERIDALTERSRLLRGAVDAVSTGALMLRPELLDLTEQTKELNLEFDFAASLGLPALQREMSNTEFRMQGVSEATKDQWQHFKDLEAQQKQAGDEIQRDWERTRNVFSDAFADMALNGDNAFKSIAESFKKMLVTMVADFAASKIMDFLGITAFIGGGGIRPGGSGIGGSVVSGAASGAASGIFGGIGGGGGIGGALSGLASGASGFAQGLFGYGQGAASFVGPMTGAASAGAGLQSFLLGPGGIAIAAGLLGKVIHDKTNDPDGFHRSMGGFLASDTPSARPGGSAYNSTFNVKPFATGFAPVGFADGPTTIADANKVIDQFRFLDQTIVDLVSNIEGASINLSQASLGGFGLDGTGAGTFFGRSQRTTDPQFQHQLNSFARQLGNHITGLTPDAMAQIAGANSANDLVNVLSQLVDATKANTAVTGNAGVTVSGTPSAIGPTLPAVTAGRLSGGITPESIFNPNSELVQAMIGDPGTHFVNGVQQNPITFAEKQRRERVQRNLARVARGYDPGTGTYRTMQEADPQVIQNRISAKMGIDHETAVEQLLMTVVQNTSTSARIQKKHDSDGLPDTRS